MTSPSHGYDSAIENLNHPIVEEELRKLFLNGRIQSWIAVTVKKVVLEQIMDYSMGVQRN